MKVVRMGRTGCQRGRIEMNMIDRGGLGENTIEGEGLVIVGTGSLQERERKATRGHRQRLENERLIRSKGSLLTDSGILNGMLCSWTIDWTRQKRREDII